MDNNDMFNEYMKIYAKDIANVFLISFDNYEEISNEFAKWREDFSVYTWTEILKQIKKCHDMQMDIEVET